MPHSALLVGLIFPATLSSVSAPASPTSCLALSACGENLRLWPRLARNSIHTDIKLTPTGDLVGDEAVQLERTSVPGTFVLATRTGRLILVDPRNARNGVSCRPLVNTTKPDCRPVSSGFGATSNLLSGIGRKVSNIFGLVGFSNAVGSRIASRNSANTFFVRLVTRSSASPSGLCFVYMLLGNQLEVWSLDQSLEEQLHNVFTVESLLSSSMNESSFDHWHAVDMTVQHTRSFVSTNELVYILIGNSSAGTSGSDAFYLLTLSLGGSDSNVQFCQTFSTSLVPVDWPFGSGHQIDAVQFCLPAAHSADLDLPPVYPCLLACLHCVPSGQVAIVEVLTGHLVAKLQFGQHTGSNEGVRLPPASGLLGCGGVEPNNLFVFVTAQRGLLTLAPVTGSVFSTNISQMSEFNSISGHGSSQSFKMKSSNLSIDSVSSEPPKTRIECMPVVLVRTHEKGLIHVAIQLASDRLSLWDPNDTARAPLLLSPADLTFAALSEAARVFWMGFREQTSKYISALLKEPGSNWHIAPGFLRLSRRVLNECPLSDARWRSILTSATEDHDRVITEGCSGFQYVVPKSGSGAPLHTVLRFDVKQEAIQRVKELWTLACDSSHWLCTSGILLDISTAHRHLGLNLSASDSGLDISIDGDTGIRRCFAGEVDFSSEAAHTNEEDSVIERYACMLADDSNAVEACARRLLRSLDPGRIMQAAEDEPGDHDSDRCAKLHFLSGLHVCEELIEFARAVYLKLIREPFRRIQPIMQAVAMEAGFSAEMLQTVKARDVIFQTVTLIPNLVVGLGDAVIRDSDILASETSAPPSGSVSLHLKTNIAVSNSAVEMFWETAKLLSAGLSAVSAFRDRQIQSLLNVTVGPANEKTHYLLCWLTDARPFGVGDILLTIFERLVQLGSGEWSLSSDQQEPSESADVPDMIQLTKDAAAMAIEWADNLLNIARHRVQWATASSAWSWSHSSDSSLESDLHNLKRRVETVQRLRRMRFWFVQLRKRLIDTVADHLLRPEAALVLAERFADCNQMVRLCYLLEVQGELSNGDSAESSKPHHHHRWLAELLKRVPTQYGLADQALQWYFSCGEHARVQSLLTLLEQLKKSDSSAEVDHYPEPAAPSLSRAPWSHQTKPFVDRLKEVSDPVYRFLHREDARDHAWPHLMSTRHYSKAARILFEEGCKELRFVGRRKTLLSLAKLAILASDPDVPCPEAGDVSFEKDPLVTKIDLLLEWIWFQEHLPSELRVKSILHTLSDHGLGEHHDPVISIEALARLYVSSVDHASNGDLRDSSENPDSISSHEDAEPFRCDLAEFRAAFRLADLLVEVNDLSSKYACTDPTVTRDALLTHIWCQALKMNDWLISSRHDDPVQLFGRSFICDLVRDISRTHQTVAQPLFSPEKLLACPALEGYVDNLQFRYLVQSGLEFLQSLI
ncbi:unnamed protein product [Dicrocoelium dendriticum]|nr:unnamed protein product [Dicrocoelium dendriticum]